jgi:hypothetical protein
VTIGAPCSTALTPPTTMNSTLPLLRALTILSVKFCTAQGFLDEESPGFMVTQSFGGGQPQSLRDLRPIHVALMAEVEQRRIRRWRRQCGNGRGFHTRIIMRMKHQGNPRDATPVRAVLSRIPRLIVL